ncbi:MAG: exodeoxyribonuclease VII small subunit [Phycisphaerae bacterium]|nr:exodeoxyribonuclease VII small subunit [Phycisphaerae bacterium]
MGIEKNKEEVGELSFEDAIDKLADIVSGIESGKVPLQRSLEQYERGMELINRCRGILREAEKRIEKISAQEDQEKQ